MISIFALSFIVLVLIIGVVITHRQIKQQPQFIQSEPSDELPISVQRELILMSRDFRLWRISIHRELKKHYFKSINTL